MSAEAEGRSWTPTLSAATPVSAVPKRAATSAATRSLGSQRSNNSSGRSSPAFGNNNGFGNGFGGQETTGPTTNKERNETYFATLGQANNTRDE